MLVGPCLLTHGPPFRYLKGIDSEVEAAAVVRLLDQDRDGLVSKAEMDDVIERIKNERDLASKKADA